MVSPDGAVPEKHAYTCLQCLRDPLLQAKWRGKENQHNLVLKDFLILEE